MKENRPRLWLLWAWAQLLQWSQRGWEWARTRFWPWYRRQGRNMQVGIGCGTLVVVCACCGALLSRGPSTTTIGLAPTATVEHVAQVTTAATATHARPQPTATAISTTPPTSTPQPPTPVPTADNRQLFVQFTGASAAVGQNSFVSVQTLPGAQLTITVVYCNGNQATSKSLQGTFSADDNGDYTWSWRPATTCHGPATATVKASLNSQNVTQSEQFTVA